MVSYFEWLKNLNNISYGRLTWKHEEQSYHHIFDSVQKSMESNFPGQKIPIAANESFQKVITERSEKDIVNSGIEYSMLTSAQQIDKTVQLYGLRADLRTAAYIVGLEKIFNPCNDSGAMFI